MDKGARSAYEESTVGVKKSAPNSLPSFLGQACTREVVLRLFSLC